MKKLLALFLAAVLTLSLMIVPTVAATDVSSVTELPAYTEGGSLTATKYKISTADGFTNLKDWVAAGETFAEKTVYLAANNLETTVSIGDSTNAFGGIFDGNGNSLKLTQTDGNGLFAYATGATIQNLTIAEGSAVTRVSNAVGAAAVVGMANDVILDNVINYATVTNNCSKSSVAQTAGLVGCLSAGNLTITNCANHGNVSDASTLGKGDEIAGILAYSTSETGAIRIEKTINTGNITCLGQDAAGIVAFVKYGVSVTINNCVNTGEINANTGKQWAAGIIARCAITLNIDKCQNHGNIVALGDIGGIVGRASGGNNHVVTNCLNTGTITFYATDCDVNRMAGGVIGRMQGTDGTINDCLNYGYVKAINAVAGGAGILGVSQNTAITMENCTNYGVVSAAKKSSGTINEKIVSGWNGSCEPTPTNCADKSSYTTQMVGYQIAKVSDTNAKADLRIIASVDSANHTNVGFNVVVKDANGNEVAKVENYKCQTIYRNLSALGVNDAISASAYRNNGDADDGYLFAIVIQDLPVENIEETYYFEITTFVDGEATNCDTASFGVAQPESGN